MSGIRVLVVDDSALMRRTLSRIIEGAPGLCLAGTARDGADAISKARELRPDVITMDINMPRVDGISALQVVVAEGICPVIMVSSLTQEGAVTTFEAMELGAFDYVGKPGGTVSAEMSAVSADLVAKIHAAARAGTTGRLKEAAGRRHKPREVFAARPSPAPEKIQGYKAVAIGISTGGPSTLMEVLPRLPADLNAAVFLVQHMPPAFTSGFTRRLGESCPLKVVEAEAGAVVEPRTCYVARGGYHLTLFAKGNGEVILRTPSIPQTLFVPSVDVMMDSVLKAYGPRTIGVLMTGIGDDGAAAMLNVFRAGGYTIAESEQTAVVFGMPREAIERGAVKEVTPSWDVARAIVKAV